MSGIVRSTVFACLAASIALPAAATDRLGFYVGAAAGNAKVKADNDVVGEFSQSHFGFKVMAGVRPLPFLGAELAYADFGRAQRLYGISFSSVKMKGESAFGVLYLPVSNLDVFVKAGAARMESTSFWEFRCPPLDPCPFLAPTGQHHDETHFAAGAGAQVKLGPVHVRAEYERFTAAGSHPAFASIGVLWTPF